MSQNVFAEEMLALIKRTFFARTTPKKFFQERNLLLSAIAFPAAHLKERYGVNTPDSLTRAILRTVIEAILKFGSKKRDRFSVYFLHCVQEHMKHHGEEHYETAKAALRIAESLPEILARVRLGEAEQSTEAFVRLHHILRSRGGRKKQRAEAQLDLI